METPSSLTPSEQIEFNAGRESALKGEPFPAASSKATQDGYSSVKNPGAGAPSNDFEAGRKLAHEGKLLPADASQGMRDGYNSSGPSGKSSAKPEAPLKVEPKVLVSHKTAPKAQTDRPEFNPPPKGHEEPANPNENVKITVVEPGKVYKVEGIGAGCTIDFKNVTEEALLAILIDRLEGLQSVPGGYSVFHENAGADLTKSLNWFHQRTRDRESQRAAQGFPAGRIP